MSTLPHDAHSRADSATLITTAQGDSELDSVVWSLESLADEVGMPRPSTDELRDLCRQVVRASRRIFPGDVRIRVGRDREIADDIYFVVEVWTSGTPDEVVARANEWHLAEHEIAGKQWRLFCLSFHIV